MRVKYLAQDFHQRIDNGICFYKKVPYLINLQSDGTFSLFSLMGNAETVYVSIQENDPELDISAPKLGYMNTADDCLYVIRRPERKYKQTLVTNGLFAYRPAIKGPVGPDTISSYMFSVSGFEMLMNIYPTLDDVMHQLQTKEVLSRAISRDVAISRRKDKLRVFFKTEEIGIMDATKKIVSIPQGENAWIISKYLAGYDWAVN